MLCSSTFVAQSQGKSGLYCRYLRQIATQGKRCSAASIKAAHLEALLQEIEVRTSGKGRAKRAEIVFHWLEQDPFSPFSLKDLTNKTTDPALFEEVNDDAS